MPKRDRAEYMRRYRAKRKTGHAEPPSPAPELPDADPWRTMTAADALKWLLKWDVEQRQFANPEPDFWDVPYKQRAQVRKEWREANGKCKNCGGTMPADSPMYVVNCAGCRESRNAQRWRRRSNGYC